VNLKDKLSPSEKVKIKSMLASETGEALRKVMTGYMKMVKNRLFSEFDDPERILREREKGRGVQQVWKKLNEIAENTQYANSEA